MLQGLVKTVRVRRAAIKKGCSSQVLKKRRISEIDRRKEHEMEGEIDYYNSIMPENVTIAFISQSAAGWQVS